MKTKRTRIYEEIPADELHLLVFMSRAVLHRFFRKRETLERFPLVMKIPNPKTGKDRLVNLSAREEFYGRIPMMDLGTRMLEAAKKLKEGHDKQQLVEELTDAAVHDPTIQVASKGFRS